MTPHDDDDPTPPRIGALRARRARLEAEIAEEVRRPAPDALRLQTLKRRRLKAKDEMAGVLRTLSRPDQRPAA